MKFPNIDPDAWDRACHEAAHVVVGEALGSPAKFVTIRPGYAHSDSRWMIGGYVKSSGSALRLKYRALENRAITDYMAGMAGDLLRGMTPADARKRAAHDINVVQNLTNRHRLDADELERWLARARNILVSRCAQWSRVANALFERWELDEQDIREVLRSRGHIAKRLVVSR